MTLTCGQCGEGINSDDKFCGHCGHQLVQSAVPVAGTQVEMKLVDVQYNLAVVYLKNGKYAECLQLLDRVEAMGGSPDQVARLRQQATESMNAGVSS